MKRYRLWMLGAFVVVTALLVGATIKARQNPLYALAHYPRTPAFDRYMSVVAQDLQRPTLSHQKILIRIEEPVIEDFRMMSGTEIGQDGQFKLDFLFPGKGAPRFGAPFSLNAQHLATIKNLVSQMPKSAPPSKSEDLLIVMVYAPSSVQLHLYNNKEPPPEVVEINRITEAVKNRAIRARKQRASNSQRAVN